MAEVVKSKIPGMPDALVVTPPHSYPPIQRKSPQAAKLRERAARLKEFAETHALSLEGRGQMVQAAWKWEDAADRLDEANSLLNKVGAYKWGV